MMKTSRFVSQPAPVESLLNDDSTGVWSALAVNPKQVDARRELRAKLDYQWNLYRERLWTGKMPPVELYYSLNELLSSGEDDRFLLYCPLSLIPRGDWYRRYDDAVDTFSELYLESWHRLLTVNDIRADFIDGDLPDIEDNQWVEDRVCQAGFLAPILLEKGLISGESLDDFQKESIRNSTAPYPHPNPVVDMRIPLNDFHNFVTRQLEEDNTCCLGVSEKRLKWLRWEKRRKTIENIGCAVGKAFLHGQDLKGMGTTVESTSCIIVGIRSAVEMAWLQGEKEKAIIELYQVFEPILTEFAQDERVRDHVVKAFCRWHSIGINLTEKREELNIFYPNLAGPFYGNLSPFEDNRNSVMEILKDPELLEVIYPVSIVYGSTLKGYGLNSDIDRAVFVRPEIQRSTWDRAGVRNLIKSKLGDVVEYWLDGDEETGLAIHDFPDLEAKTGESPNTHVLFNGVWEGDPETMSMMAERLLKPYLRVGNKLSRSIWLHEMERDVLQYRLLHRGYETFHVPRTRETWWDEGYRFMAARLYSSHVFLPKL